MYGEVQFRILRADRLKRVPDVQRNTKPEAVINSRNLEATFFAELCRQTCFEIHAHSCSRSPGGFVKWYSGKLICNS